MKQGGFFSPARIGTLAALLGVVTGLLISAPWAGGQDETACQPLQTVSERMLGKLERMNRKLDEAIEDGVRLRLSEFYGRISELRQLKHELIRDHFPPLFGLSPLRVYLELEDIDRSLDDARDAKSREGGNPRGHLRAAKRHKQALEGMLRESPCQTPR